MSAVGPTLKPSDALDGAADLVTPKGAWMQRLLANRDLPKATCFCAMGAVTRAAFDALDDREAARAMAWTAREWFLRVAGTSYSQFNDALGREQPEVVAALRKAAELARSEGQ